MKAIRKKIFKHVIYAVWLGIFAATGCTSDPRVEPVGEAALESFAPTTGRSGTEITIQGRNFGNSAANVQVWVNNVAATVRAVTSTKIFALVPQSAGSGLVKVIVNGQELQAETAFSFTSTRTVSTYTGSGAAVSVDGSLRQASFVRPYWLTYDKKDDALFVLEEGRRVRRIKDGYVETVATLMGSINNPRSISMSLSADTLFIGNDNGGNNSNVTVAILTRATDFRAQEDYVPSTDITRHVNFAGVHPSTGALIFYCWPRKLYTWNKSNRSVELLADLVNVAGISGDYYANFCFSPDGKALYLVIKYPFIGILKAPYDPATGKINGAFERLAGTGTWGALDGQGTAASFDQPAQALMLADGHFLIAEKYNHIIRMISPSGMVSRYAGDGGPGNQGFVNGASAAAKFNEPEGIAIDKNGQVFIADLRNSRIRVIREE